VDVKLGKIIRISYNEITVGHFRERQNFQLTPSRGKKDEVAHAHAYNLVSYYKLKCLKYMKEL
jgi:hypothetical protein